MISTRWSAVLAVLSLAAAGPARAGMEMNGMEMNGVSLNDVTLDGASLTGVHLEGSTLTGTRRDGDTVTGDAMVGAKLKGWTAGGAKVTVRIDGYSQDGDVSRYAASYTRQTDDAQGDWQPICRAGGDAVPIYGTWNADGSRSSSSSVVTFACPGGALAKCIDIGYAPWRSSSGTSLAPYHQACTRAIRADYCGDGTSYTQNGNRIDLYDAIGVQVDTEAWTPEAEWSEEGATCMSGLASRAQAPVACEAQKVAPSCAAGGPGAGSLLVTEVP